MPDRVGQEAAEADMRGVVCELARAQALRSSRPVVTDRGKLAMIAAGRTVRLTEASTNGHVESGGRLRQ